MKERNDFFVSALEEDKDKLLAELNELETSVQDAQEDDADTQTKVQIAANSATEVVNQADIDAIANLTVPDPPHEPEKPIAYRLQPVKY